MGRFKGRAFWERVVADVDAGMSQVEAARRHRVSQSGLGYWVRRIGAEKARPAEPQLLPVRITSAAVASSRCAIVLGDLRFEFETGTEPAYVAAVAAALRAC
jgi:hypothetical protein